MHLKPFLLQVLAAVCLALIPVTSLAETWQPSGNIEQIKLWPNGAPNREKEKELPESVSVDNTDPGTPVTRTVSNVTDPTIAVFPPKGISNHAAIVVFPGGGYRVLAIDYEGTKVCDWLTPLGFTCVVLK